MKSADEELTLLDFSTLFAGGAISAFVIAGMIFAACAILRKAGYLLTLACGVLSLGLACGSACLYRLGQGAWLGVAMMVSGIGAFFLIHWAMSLYVGRRGPGLFEYAALPVTAACLAIFELGYDGAALALCHGAAAVLVLDTGLLYWSHRKEVPYLMQGLAFLAVSAAFLFAARSYAIVAGGSWVIGAAPDNWAENLTAIGAVPFITAMGPMILALYYFRDRVALISDAVTDPLTGLHNRRALLEEFAPHPFTPGMAVVMFDLDHFKRTNDVFGHQIGDEVLKRFAYVVGRHATGDVKAYRLGGEEFALVVTRGGARRGNELASRISVAFGAEVVPTQIGPLRSTVSAGVAAGSEDALRLDRVIALADAALYEAKRQGRNRVVHNSGALAKVQQARRVA